MQEFITFLESFNSDLSNVLKDAYNSIFESEYLKTNVDDGERIASLIINSDLYDKFETVDNGGYIFDFDDFNLVLYKEISRAIGEYAVFNNTPTIIMYILDDKLNSLMSELASDWSNNREYAEIVLKSIKDKLLSNRTVIIHEWTHRNDDKAGHLLTEKNKIRKPSIEKIKTKADDLETNIGKSIDYRMLQLINSDIEFNAELVSAIAEAKHNGKTNSFDEFLDSILKSAQFKSIYASNKTILIDKLYKKLLKYAYQYYDKYLR